LNAEQISQRFRSLSRTKLARPGAGATAQRHRAIFDAGREDLSLAKLIEAHWDAVAILEEAGHEPAANATYAVWASELPGRQLVYESGSLHGTKEFCSGAALVDRALVSAGPLLVEIDLRGDSKFKKIDESSWLTEAFRSTRTAAVTFLGLPVVSVLGEGDWYTHRSGFWQGACGPAAAWAGGAAGLVEYALTKLRDDPHSSAHLGAMHANVSAMEAVLEYAGDAFDCEPHADAMVRSLEVRHTVEQLSTDVLRRFARSLGPAPLVKDAGMIQRYAELDLFLRQSHAERDLESLGTALRNTR
jgi:hypothetical protein